MPRELMLPLALLAGAATFGLLFWRLKGRCAP